MSYLLPFNKSLLLEIIQLKRNWNVIIRRFNTKQSTQVMDDKYSIFILFCFMENKYSIVSSNSWPQIDGHMPPIYVFDKRF